jgi:dipeptidyl aminopeptidase/acylaminoacyl peptidase
LGNAITYYWLHEIGVPILILRGERDKSIDVSQSKKLSERLIREGIMHELVVFLKGYHSLSAHRPEVHQGIYEWFEKHIDQS